MKEEFVDGGVTYQVHFVLPHTEHGFNRGDVLVFNVVPETVVDKHHGQGFVKCHPVLLDVEESIDKKPSHYFEKESNEDAAFREWASSVNGGLVSVGVIFTLIQTFLAICCLILVMHFVNLIFVPEMKKEKVAYSVGGAITCLVVWAVLSTIVKRYDYWVFNAIAHELGVDRM